jgi:HPt (histidine-containing phosphotransfer) domain-containing protein
MKGDRERCLDAGMDGYVTKPVHPGELFETIGRLLGTETPANEQKSNGHDQQQWRAGEEDRTKGTGTLVNWDVARQTAMGDDALLGELIDIFLKNAGTLVDEIDMAIDANDSHSLRLAAHSLKSNCRAFGAAAAEHLAFHIENTARDGSADVAQAVQKLKQQIGQIQAELCSWVTGRTTLSQATKSVTTAQDSETNR